MTQVTIDNEAVSETLLPGDSVTVPSGEVWRVTLTMDLTRTLGSGNEASGKINGRTILGFSDGQRRNTQVETVLTGGDTISFDSSSVEKPGLHIGGFKVKE